MPRGQHPARVAMSKCRSLLAQFEYGGVAADHRPEQALCSKQGHLRIVCYRALSSVGWRHFLQAAGAEALAYAVYVQKFYWRTERIPDRAPRRQATVRSQ